MLQILRYRLYLAHDPANPSADNLSTRDVVIMPGDRMRAERESTKLLSPAQRNRKANPETWMLLWLWCTATRLGHFAGTLEDFGGTLLDYDELDETGNPVAKDTTPDEREDTREAVDPTAADPHTT